MYLRKKAKLPEATLEVNIRFKLEIDKNRGLIQNAKKKAWCKFYRNYNDTYGKI